MKPLSSILRTATIMLLLPGGISAVAQALPGLTSSGADASLTRLFGEHTAFSAEATLAVKGEQDQELLTTRMGYAVRDGKVRMDVDLAQLQSRELPAGLGASLEPLGMKNVVSLILPEQRASYLIYPGLKSILRVPMDPGDLKAGSEEVQFDRVALGKETLDGHACIRYLVTVTDSSGARQEAVTWNAADLKGFPIQIRMADGDNLILMRFRNVRLTAPGVERFAIPATYTHYDSQGALMQGVMMKALGGASTLGEP